MGEGDKLIRTLAEEPGMAGLVDPRALVLVWTLNGERVLWSSGAADEMLASMASTGRTFPQRLRDRLRELGAGTAPRNGFRLERLRLGPGGLDPLQTVFCRIIPFDGADALLTAVPASGAFRTVAHELKPELSSGDHQGHAGAVDLTPAIPVPAGRGRRFTWSSDREHRFTAVSNDLAAAVGVVGSTIVGSRWQDLIGRVVLDEGGTLSRAFASGRPWSRLPVEWRDADRDVVVPVELSGAPILGLDAQSAGHRGFGLVHPDATRPAPPRMAGEPPPAVEMPSSVVRELSPARSDDVGASVMSVPGIEDAVQAAAALTGTAGETVFGVLRAWFTPDSVSQKPSGYWPIGEAASRSDLERAAPSQSADRSLSLTERGALHEIARALSAREDASPRLDSPTAEIVALSSARPRDAEAARLLEAVPLGIMILRDETPILANRHLLGALGDEDLPSLVARGGAQALVRAGLDGAEAGEPFPVALRNRAGEALAFDVRTASVGWGDLPAKLVSLTPIRDLGPEQRAEALQLELAATQGRVASLSQALELASDGVVSLDASGRILAMTRSAERLFGFAVNEIAGDPVTELVLPEDHRATLAALERAESSSGTTATCDVRGRLRSRRSIMLSLRVARAGGPPGAGYTVAFRDVSGLKALEESLRSIRGGAERESGHRAEFLARISHEIRTPLTAITGFAELMLEERFGAIGSERYRGYIRDIHESGGQVISLVNDLLDLAKVTGGRTDLAPTSLDVNAIAEECMALVAPLAARSRAIVRTSFAAALPRAFADARSVRQIVVNVMSNAVRLAGTGGQVIVSTTPGAPGEVLLRVRDTGPGMGPDEIEAALTPFRQVAATRRGDATGLGLPLAKALVEANRGIFTVTSAPDSGTLIEIRLPASGAGSEAIAAE